MFSGPLNSPARSKPKELADCQVTLPLLPGPKTDSLKGLLGTHIEPRVLRAHWALPRGSTRQKGNPLLECLSLQPSSVRFSEYDHPCTVLASQPPDRVHTKGSPSNGFAEGREPHWQEDGGKAGAESGDRSPPLGRRAAQEDWGQRVGSWGWAKGVSAWANNLPVAPWGGQQARHLSSSSEARLGVASRQLGPQFSLALRLRVG